ncbi:hypothetical protein BZZ01_01910 [Nostocales cyanobacterium HT-58-2]|nr:hypothetical protein BZZ01_01910 [Nostocales cyanobacterium HT-58-2]
MQRPQSETVTLDDILITEELSRRSPRPPNLLSENQALHTLARQLVNQPETMLQTLVDISLDLCFCGTAGVSLLETTANREEIFRWNVLAGALAQYVGGTTPRNFSPCGACLEHGTPVLFSYPERYFTYFQDANTPIVEGLVLPLITDNHALGTIWIMSHDEQRHFDAEDVRVMTSLADFTAAALLLNQRQTHQLLAKNAQLEAEAVERKRSQEALRQSEERFRLFVTASSDIIYRMSADWREMRNLEGKNFIVNTEHPSQTWMETYIPQEEQPRVWATIQDAIRTKSIFELEHCVIQQDGAISWTFSRAIPLLNEQGDIVEWFGTASDVTDRKQAEVALRESEARLALELADAKQLQFISSQLVQEENIDALYGQILEAAIALMRSEMGSMQLLHPDRNELQLLVWKGFDPASAAFWERVQIDSETPCGIALNTGKRAIIPDIETYEFIAGSEDLDAFRRSGIRAVQTTPLISRSGRVVGMISTHWQEPRQPSERELGLLGVLARQAADLIEQRQAQLALRESEAKYRSLFESLDEGYLLSEVIFDENDKPIDILYLEANPAAVRLAGRDFSGQRMREIDPNYEEYWYEIYGRVALTGESVRAERYAEPHGRWFDFYAFKVGRQESRRVAAVFNDITDRKRREAHLAFLADIAENFSRLSTADEIMRAVSAKVGAYLNTTNCLFAEINEGQDQAIIECTWHTSDTPDVTGVYRLSDFITEQLRQTARAGETIIIRNTQTDPRVDSDRYAALKIHAYVTVPFYREGEWKYVFTVNDSVARNWREDEIELIREVTNRTFPRLERAYAEQALRESEEKYRSLFESINDGFALLEVLYDDDNRPVDCRFLEVSPSFEFQTGLPQAQGKTLRELIPSVESGWFEHYHQALVTNALVHFEMHQNYLKIWFEVDVFPYGNPQDRRVTIVFRNINERKQAQANQIQLIREQAAREQERQRAETLAELDHAKTDFFSNVSHEFRTPLTLSLAPLQDALSDRTNPLAPPQRERVELAHRNAIRLLKLVNTLLDFSRIEAGRMQAVYEATDLALLTTGLASGFRSAIERAGLRLIVDCPPLPEPVYVDREMWEKIVLNLLSNAFKFTFAGEIAVRLHPADDHYVTLQVQDTGTGISPEELPHLFERFYQVRGAKARTHEGSGIGLALVHELIRLHGGTLDVSSTVEQGTCFTVTIPLGTAHLPSDRIEATRTLVSTALGAAPYVEEAESWLPPEEGEQGAESREQGAEESLDTRSSISDTRSSVSDTRSSVSNTRSSVSNTRSSVSDTRSSVSDTHSSISDTRSSISDTRSSISDTRSSISDTRSSISDTRSSVSDTHSSVSDTRSSVSDTRSSVSDAPPASLPPSAHILLVDDNADMRDYLTRILSEHVEVIAVADGVAALAAAQERVPDLILSDVMMPQLDGFELLKALRADARTREVPIILLSACAGEESVVEGLQAGADDYLIKPFSATELVTRVLAHLQMAHLRLEALRQERTTSRRKDEMLSTVSHELNTPLVAILGWTRLLRTSPLNQSMLMKSLETIERNATLQAKLISDLLDISRITAGKLHLNLQPVELQSVIETAIATVPQPLQAKEIRLMCLLDPLPIIIQGDPERLQQIVLNLLTNAIKFTPQGGRIEVCLNNIETQAQIKVSDTGCGIAAEFLPYVFESFRQAESSKSQSTKGLGLGLAIARHLVELHGGTIQAESLGVGQGATFTVNLPLIDASLEERY